MADFTALTDKEFAALKRHEMYERHARRFELLQLGERSALRLVEAMSGAIDRKDARQMGLLAALTGRAAAAYDRLQHHDDALRFARTVARLALKHAGLGDSL
ncbi:MAG TPA: hypothetical protein VGL11_02845 [Candidatus Binatia bacterium]|jgi:hypothetical protein